MEICIHTDIHVYFSDAYSWLINSYIRHNCSFEKVSKWVLCLRHILSHALSILKYMFVILLISYPHKITAIPY